MEWRERDGIKVLKMKWIGDGDEEKNNGEIEGVVSWWCKEKVNVARAKVLVGEKVVRDLWLR